MSKPACHPQYDQIAVHIQSALLQKKLIAIALDFPYGSPAWGGDAADWNSPDKHTSGIITRSEHSVVIQRNLDSCTYYVSVQWTGDANLEPVKKHSFLLMISAYNRFEVTIGFSRERPIRPFPDVEKTFSASITYWQNFWKTGGVIDLSQSTDSRAQELERRIVLSRYLTTIQCSGSLPPQETGLTCNRLVW